MLAGLSRERDVFPFFPFTLAIFWFESALFLRGYGTVTVFLVVTHQLGWGMALHRLSFCFAHRASYTVGLYSGSFGHGRRTHIENRHHVSFYFVFQTLVCFDCHDRRIALDQRGMRTLRKFGVHKL